MTKLAAPQLVRTLVDRGFDAAPTREQTTALTRYFHRLARVRSAAANDEFVRVYHAVADRSAARVRPAQSLACTKGCSHCCNAHVTVLAPEAFALARAVRSGARHGPLHARLRGHVAARSAMTVAEQATVPLACSFLVDGLCSAYAPRPMTCRMFASLDVRSCFTATWHGGETIPQPPEYLPLRSMLAAMAYAAIKAAGLPVKGYELNSTVIALIERPEREAAWYTGDDPFVPRALDRLTEGFAQSIDAFVAAAAL